MIKGEDDAEIAFHLTWFYKDGTSGEDAADITKTHLDQYDTSLPYMKEGKGISYYELQIHFVYGETELDSATKK